MSLGHYGGSSLLAGNPMDFLTIQVEVPEDDAEHGLKSGLIELHRLPYCGLFCTGIESVSWKFLASLFVSSHVSLDDFILSGGNGGSAGPATAALEADEKVWGPTYVFTALRNDPDAAERVHGIIAEALESVANSAQTRKFGIFCVLMLSCALREKRRRLLSL